MKNKSIFSHKNFEYLKNLQDEMHDIGFFIIDYCLDKMNNPKEFIKADEALDDYLIDHWYSIYFLLEKRNIILILYKGEIWVYREQVNYGISISDYGEPMHFLNPHFSFFENLKQGEIVAEYLYKSRSYLLTCNETMIRLKINYEGLNKLINEGILRVVVRRFSVFFYSYQVDEILHILSTGEDHWLEFTI